MDYKERLIKEYNELDERCNKLKKALKERRNFDCPKELLYAQLNAMQTYKNILEVRLNSCFIERK